MFWKYRKHSVNTLVLTFSGNIIIGFYHVTNNTPRLCNLLLSFIAQYQVYMHMYAGVCNCKDTYICVVSKGYLSLGVYSLVVGYSVYVMFVSPTSIPWTCIILINYFINNLCRYVWHLLCNCNKLNISLGFLWIG